jgi:hypothetical protein
MATLFLVTSVFDLKIGWSPRGCGREMAFSPDPVLTLHRRRFWRLAGVLLCLLLVVMIGLAYFLLFYHPGIHVTVQNMGSQPMRAVVLFVTGNNFSLGDIPPGSAADATVKCTGDSHLEIEFVDNAGETKRLDAGGFFQSGYRGQIRLTIREGAIQDNEQDIEWWAN